MAESLERLTLPERVNFLLTNRIPRRWLTLFMGRFSKIEHPAVRALSIAVWKLFVDDLRLHEAKKARFDSLHDCFIRELKPGSRIVDADPLTVTSPCDAVIGEFGEVCGLEAIQAKGFPYSIADLLGARQNAERFRDGRFLTLRIKSSMYHRFHAPWDGRIDDVLYISGDTWNVNPIALKTVERLFCKNERAVFDLQPASGTAAVTMVAVAAILVASIRIHGVNEALNLRYRGGNTISCDLDFRKGDEIGYFEHGSTIVLFTTPEFRFLESISVGDTVRMGQAIMRKG